DAWGRADLEFVVDAVPLGATTGVMLVVEEVLDAARRQDYTRWRRETYLDSPLDSGDFAGCFHFGRETDTGGSLDVLLLFVDRADPLTAFADALATARRTSSGPTAFAELATARRPIFSGMYRGFPPGGYDFYR